MSKLLEKDEDFKRQFRDTTNILTLADSMCHSGNTNDVFTMQTGMITVLKKDPVEIAKNREAFKAGDFRGREEGDAYKLMVERRGDLSELANYSAYMTMESGKLYDMNLDNGSKAFAIGERDSTFEMVKKEDRYAEFNITLNGYAEHPEASMLYFTERGAELLRCCEHLDYVRVNAVVPEGDRDIAENSLFNRDYHGHSENTLHNFNSEAIDLKYKRTEDPENQRDRDALKDWFRVGLIEK